MGKSPGKWIKSVLFRKKSSNSSLPKKRDIVKSSYEKASSAPLQEPVSNAVVQPCFISEPVLVTEITAVSISEPTLSSTRENGDARATLNHDVPDELEKYKLEQAATKAQATFRGYRARRAFRTLKGIIRLQAVIRGHLVRRQAVATLNCFMGIVKFQALVRGRMVRRSDIGSQIYAKQTLSKQDGGFLDSVTVYSCGQRDKLKKNAFTCQLLSSSTSAMPLRLPYDPVEPNSAWNWLLRWTMSHFSAALLENETITMSKNKIEARPVSKISRPGKKPVNVGETFVRSTSPNKATQVLQGVAPDSVGPKNCMMLPVGEDLISDSLDKKLMNETRDSEKDLLGQENHKIAKRRASLPAKHDDQETSQHGTKVPSYMAATKSAKAKVRGQGSPRFGQEDVEKNGPVRRYSLPSSVNARPTSSPRVQRLVQSNGKSGIRIDRSLSSSRDGNEKMVQPGWKR